MSFDSTFLWAVVLRKVSSYPKLKFTAQKFRYFLMRGPLQKVFVSYYRARSKKLSIALQKESIFSSFNVNKTVEEINDRSYSACLKLPPETIKELLGFYIGKRSTNIHHPHRECSTILSIAHDPQIIAVVRGYFRAEPIFYGSRLYYTHPRMNAEGEVKLKYRDAKMVHFDVTDFLEMNVFFYLSDVDHEASPHKLFPGTHKRKTFRDLMAMRYTENEARKRFGDNFVTLTGKAGVGFFEDPGAFHIQSPGKKGRMMLSLGYTLHRRAELAQH